MRNQSLLFCGLIIASLLLACNNEKNNEKNSEKIEIDSSQSILKMNLTSITFDNKVFDFGKVSSDTTLIATYGFTNSGDTTLVIDYVNPDCICTNYSMSSKTIAPGDKGYIKLILDTKGKIGRQKINATIRANTESRFHLIILKAMVE